MRIYLCPFQKLAVNVLYYMFNSGLIEVAKEHTKIPDHFQGKSTVARSMSDSWNFLDYRDKGNSRGKCLSCIGRSRVASLVPLSRAWGWGGGGVSIPVYM